MAIININDDSFSGDGTLDTDKALRKARTLYSQGADIIDVGGESARTNRPPVPEDTEIKRVAPFIEAFHQLSKKRKWHPADSTQLHPPLLSINTWRPAVARDLSSLGCHILNDMGGLPDSQNADIARERGCSLLIMHTLGTPKTDHSHIRHHDILETLRAFFTRKIALAEACGLSKTRLILDPGLDFAKTSDDSLRVLANIQSLTSWGIPLLLPISRKNFLGSILGETEPCQRDPGMVACISTLPVDLPVILRVHNVQATIQALKT